MWWLWDEQRPLKKRKEDSLFCQRLSKKSLWIHYIRHNISKSLAAFCSSIKRANDDGVYYRVSQQVWNSLNVIFWSSEVCIRRLQSFRRNVFCSKKLLFAPYLWTAKLKMEFFSNFAPIVLCINLSSKFHEIGEKLLKNPFSVLAVFKKG